MNTSRISIFMNYRFYFLDFWSMNKWGKNVNISEEVKVHKFITDMLAFLLPSGLRRPLYWQLSSTDAFQITDLVVFFLGNPTFLSSCPFFFQVFILLDKWSLEKLKNVKVMTMCHLRNNLINVIDVALGWLKERQQRHVLLIKGRSRKKEVQLSC